FPPTSPSVGCPFGQRTFAGATRNGRDAPRAVTQPTATRRLGFTLRPRPTTAVHPVGRILAGVGLLGSAGCDRVVGENLLDPLERLLGGRLRCHPALNDIHPPLAPSVLVRDLRVS